MIGFLIFPIIIIHYMKIPSTPNHLYFSCCSKSKKIYNKTINSQGGFTMIEAILDANSRMASLKVNGNGSQIFIETCMFLDSIYQNIRDTAGEEEARNFFEAVINNVTETIEDDKGMKFRQSAQIDGRFAEFLKQYGENREGTE